MVAETILNRDEVLRILTESDFTSVSFYKVNGEIRNMLCTLNSDQLAILSIDPEFKDAGLGRDEAVESHTDYDENQVRVFDLEKKGWRSFLLTNLITIEGINT